MRNYLTLGPMFLALLRPYRLLIVAVCLLTLLAQVLGVILPISLGKYLGLLFDYQSLRARWLDGLPAGWFDTIPHFLGFFAGVMLLKAGADWGMRYLRRRISLDWVMALQERLFAKQLRIAPAEYHQKGTGRYLLRWSGDLSSLRSWLERGVFQAMADALLLTLALGWLLSRFPQVLAWWLPGLALMGLGLYAVMRQVYGTSRRRRDIRSRVLRHVQQRLLAIETVQAYNRSVPEQKRMARLLGKTRQRELRYAFWQSATQALAPLLVYLLLGLLLLACALDPPAEPGELLSALLLLVTLKPMARRLLQVGLHWTNGRIAAQKLQRLMDLPEGQAGTRRYRHQQGRIELRGLQFAYPQAKEPLSFDDRLIPGLGVYDWPLSPGAGKTTLLRLLTGLYRPEPGQLWLDGQDVSGLEGKSLRRRIAVVSTAWPLLGRTVFEAVSYSRARAKRPPVQAWLDRLQADLPPEERLGLDHTIGEGGCRLSRAQASMLRYVRAFLTQKPLLLVEGGGDELDPRVAPKVRQCLAEWGETQTVLRLGAWPQMTPVAATPRGAVPMEI